jgi:hypothetical protein
LVCNAFLWFETWVVFAKSVFLSDEKAAAVLSSASSGMAFRCFVGLGIIEGHRMGYLLSLSLTPEFPNLVKGKVVV